MMKTLYHLTSVLVLLLLFTHHSFCQTEVACYPDHPEFTDGETLCETIGSVQYDLIIEPNTLASQLNLPNWFGRKTAFNKNVLVKGDLFVDVDLTFWNCNVEFWGGVEVFVNSGASIAGVYSNFYACNWMWQGFNIQNASAIRLTNCHVEDAEIAMLIDASSSAGLAYNTFNRNHIVIQNESQLNQASELIFTSFEHNSFTCNAKLNVPRQNEYSFAGIVLNYCTVDVGRVNRPNYFSKLHYGVKGESSTMSVSNCSFTDLRTSDFPGSGIGIDVDKGILEAKTLFSQQVGNFIGGNTFQRCKDGIYGVGADLGVLHSTFLEPLVLGGGVVSEQNYGSERIEVVQNTFDNFGDQTGAITIERPSSATGGSGANVNGNVIDIDGVSSYGILMFANAPSLNSSSVLLNDINLNPQGKTLGIHVDVGLAKEYILQVNDVEFTSTTPSSCSPFDPDCRIGLRFIGGITDDHFALNNTCTGLGQMAYLNILSPNWRYCDNTSDDTEIGFIFSGISDPVRLSDNDINDHDIGLRINSDAIIGRQERRENTWLVDFTNTIYDDWAVESLHPTPITSEFVTNPSDGPDLKPPLVFPPAGLFRDETGTSNSCSTFPLVSGSEDSLIAANTAPLNQSSANLWDLSYELLFKMYRNPQIGVEHPAAQTYFNSMSGTTQRDLAGYTSDYFDLMSAPITTTAMMDSLRDSIELVYEELAAIDTTFSSFDTFDIDTNLVALKRQKLQTITMYQTNLSNLKTIIKTNRTAGLTTLLSNIESYSTSTDVELNQKTVLATSIRRVLGNSLPNEQATLEGIASKCSKDGGKAVLLARSLLPKCNQYSQLNYSDFDCVSNSNNALLSNEDTQLDIEWAIAPNPAYSEVVISFDKGFTGTVQILSMDGRVAVSKNVSSVTTETMDLTVIKNGIYLIKLIDENDKTSFEKLIKQ